MFSCYPMSLPSDVVPRSVRKLRDKRLARWGWGILARQLELMTVIHSVMSSQPDEIFMIPAFKGYTLCNTVAQSLQRTDLYNSPDGEGR